MAKFKIAKSGGHKYALQIDGKSITIRDYDGPLTTMRNGRLVGTSSNLQDAIAIIKADSGSNMVQISEA